MQNSEPRDPWLPVVETADFSHSAGTARAQHTMHPPAPEKTTQIQNQAIHEQYWSLLLDLN